MSPRRSALVLALAAACTPSHQPASETAGSQDIPSPPPSPNPAEPHGEAPAPRIVPRQTPLRPSDRDTSRSPVSLTASDGTGLRLTTLMAHAVVEEPLAFTELHLVFENQNERQIEGRFEIDLPPNAAISRFAMKIGDRWQEGEVVERRAAQKAYEDFLHRRQDPALLENKAGNSFGARVFPIGPRERKELIVSYSQELPSSAEPYRLMLRGLPRLDALDARILLRESAAAPPGVTTSLTTIAGAQRIIELKKQSWTPDQDLEVLDERGLSLTALRHDNLAVARVAPTGETRAAPIGGLTVLFDTSASRALGFANQVENLAATLDALRKPFAEDFELRLIAFDQTTREIFRGKVSDLGPQHLAALLGRGALGASDLERALQSIGPGATDRLLLFTDGITTAGADEHGALRLAARALAAHGVDRIDAVIDGGIRDAEVLRQISSAELPHRGVVLDARLPLATLAHKLTNSTLRDIKVTVPGAAWVWPDTLTGLQPGDEALVYADLPATAAMRVILEGEDRIDVTIPTTSAPRPLLERAWVGARIERLGNLRSATPLADSDTRDAYLKQIVELSTRFRVLSDFTALLVLETEDDYARFGIDRNALSDILTVDAAGIGLLRRKHTPLPSPEILLDEENVESDAAAIDPPARTRTATRAEDDQKDDEASEEDARSSGPSKVRDTRPDADEDRTGRGDAPAGAGQGYGHGAGTGLGGIGTYVPTVRQAPLTVRGPLDRDIIHRVVRTHIHDIRRCYNDALALDQNDGGRVTIDFRISPDGKVTSSVATHSTLKSGAIGNCIAAAARGWSFPKPDAGGSVVVTAPFILFAGKIHADDEPALDETPAQRRDREREEARQDRIAAAEMRRRTRQLVEERREHLAETRELDLRRKLDPFTGEMKAIMDLLKARSTAAALKPPAPGAPATPATCSP